MSAQTNAAEKQQMSATNAAEKQQMSARTSPANQPWLVHVREPPRSPHPLLLLAADPLRAEADVHLQPERRALARHAAAACGLFPNRHRCACLPLSSWVHQRALASSPAEGHINRHEANVSKVCAESIRTAGYGVIGAHLSAVATGCLMGMIDAARTCDHTRRIPRLIMSLRDALEHDAGASCRAIAALHRGPVQAMGLVGQGLPCNTIGPRPERAWQALDEGRGHGRRRAHQVRRAAAAQVIHRSDLALDGSRLEVLFP